MPKKLKNPQMHKYDRGEVISAEDRPRIYMCSNFVSPERHRVMTARSGCKTRLFSFYDMHTRGKLGPAVWSVLDACEEMGIHMFLDSGAHVFQHRYRVGGKVSQKDYEVPSAETLAEELAAFKAGYAAFVKEHGHRFDVYANFDHVEHSPTVWDVQKELEGMGIAPIPTIHGDAGMDWMHRYIDAGYTYLGIGAGERWGVMSKILKYLDTAFNIAEKAGVHMHGYAMTAPVILQRYPWYSVDSATWVRQGGHGGIMVPLDRKLISVRVKTDPWGKNNEWARKICAEHDFDYPLMCAPREEVLPGISQLERTSWNMFVMHNLPNFGFAYDGRRDWANDGFLST